MTMEELAARLAVRLSEPLPGLAAQLMMTSDIRMRQLMDFSTPGEAVPSSVLILLYPDGGSASTVVIRRPEYPGVHSGQISLPGGKAEPGDRDPMHTALRETFEEIGVPEKEIRVIGKLTDLYIPPSNFLVSPFVGWIPTRPVFSIDPAEVARTVEVQLPVLLDDHCLQGYRFRIPDGREIVFPAYVIDGEFIWGATAMILSEFREILKKIGYGESVLVAESE